MMRSESGDVIANALLASDIIQEEETTLSTTDESQVKRLIPFSLPEGQVFYVRESSVAGLCTPRWPLDPVENDNFPLMATSSQVCYIIPQDCIYNPTSNNVFLSSDMVIRKTDSASAGTGSLPLNKLPSMTETSSPRWSEDKTKLLITLVKQHEKDFKSRLRPKGNIWQSIANTMSTTYKDVDKDLCYKKWSNMLRTFRAFKKRNDRSWLYYDDIDKLSVSIETRCMTYRDIRKKMDALRYTKTSIKSFLDRTSDMQEKLHVCMSNFIHKLKVLQKQSDEHVQTILSLLEEHFCNKEVVDIAAQSNEMMVCENGPTLHSTELPDLDIVCISPSSPIVEYRKSVASGECNFQLVNESCVIDSSGIHALCSSSQGAPQNSQTVLNSSGRILASSGFQDNVNAGIMWERLNGEASGTDKFPIIDLVDECMPEPEVIKVTSVVDPKRVKNITTGSGEQQIFFSEEIKHAENFLPQYVPALSGPQPNSQHSIDVNAPVHLLSQSNGTFQFVSLTKNAPMEQHSQVFGSLKKMCFSPEDDNNISDPTSTSTTSGIPMSKLPNHGESDNRSPSEDELVILSRPPENQLEDSIIPVATTSVTLQLLPGADDSYQLVVCPQDSSVESVGHNANVKFTDPWSFSVFTPICPILNVETTAGSTFQQAQEDDEICQVFTE
ncbi:unnamed protein product [Allacma fusca]|uniref:Myb-like domain-containing protein n=1 Tax=Allacma fusca TaxID=39272 RepID=A0A8J2PSE8_9HEXA|nr:unnamed protein product [Allacma fusca]